VSPEVLVSKGKGAGGTDTASEAVVVSLQAGLRWWPLTGLLAASLVGLVAMPVGGAAGRQPGGVIQGHIRLTGAVPADPTIRMGADPACNAAYTSERPTHDFVVKQADGGLANVFVKVQGSFPETPVPKAPVVLEQHGCVFRPRLVGMRVGQVLEVRNGDRTMHNLHSLSMKGNSFNVSQVVGRPPFAMTMVHEEAMLRIKCDVHTWMNVYVAVVDHPYFAVTANDGSFTIPGVPAGRQMVQIWHELYGPLAASVEVTAGGIATADFSYTGNEKAAPLADPDRQP